RTRVAATGAPAPIRGIRFQGAQAPGPVAKAAEGFLGRTATRETLLELAGVLSRAYEKSEVALYTVAIPEQDFSSGTVTVLLTEGRIARAEVKGRPGGNRQLRARMAPLLAEAPLSRATFQRQFSLMRAIPGLTFESDFADPANDGALTLTVTPKQKRTRFSGGFSNRGVDLLGDGQWDAKGEFYGLGVDGDQFTLAASAASDLRRYRFASAAYALPIGSRGLTLTANAGYFETRLRGIPVTGTAKLGGVSLGYPLVRDFHRAVDLSLGVDGIDSDNAVFGNLVASERTRAVRGGASFTDVREKRTIAFGGSLSHGIGGLGARTTAPFAEAGFFKVNGSAYAAQGIGPRVAIRVSAAGQYSRDRLPAAERFSVGGENWGRAFDTGFITADRGVGALGEVAVRPVKGDRFGNSEVYAFVDGAWVGIEGRGVPGRADYSLGSAGIGTRLRFRDKAELGLEAAHAIESPLPGMADDWRFSVMWRLSM
ncbi:ShlB/FhaC/HecB family hemolysin secretion/activation protein, partial [Sphingomonas sp. AOB5]|uniref:ShlB/FhaC/HecB family hemolysin secretion/activation protein n=1 Tax=Sphingomonas sp. AOB5 TaxID=3034017 RepID=UPI0023F87580